MGGVRRGKFNAKKVEALGCTFDSQAEHRYALWLEANAKREGFMWSHHTASIPLTVRGKLITTMRPDFTVTRLRGNGLGPEYHEVKGVATAKWRQDRKLLHALYPRLRYVVIDAGRGVCKDGKGEPALFDERPRRKRRRKK